MAEDPRKPVHDPKDAADKAAVNEPPPRQPPVEEPGRIQEELIEEDRFQGTDN